MDGWLGGLLDLAWASLSAAWEASRGALQDAAPFIVLALVRAAGVTVVSGQTGLKFSFGRATKVVGPGFHPLIPFLQVIRTLPTRDRTLDLPRQRVTTRDGLVHEVDANVVFRVIDVRRALIQIDDLDKGMLQMLGLGVQEVLRARERASMHLSDDVDDALRDTMARRLGAWGVEVQRAGFTSIEPSRLTMRVTQLAANIGERVRMLAQLEAHGVERRTALALLGAPALPCIRTRRYQQLDRARRRGRRIAHLLKEAQRAGTLPLSAVPPRWRGFYEEQSFLGGPSDPRKNLLIRLPTKKAARTDQTP